MEHDEKPLPIDIRLLGALAEKVFLFSFLSFGCVCGSFRFDTAQTLVSRFLQVSSFFEDEGESPV